MPPEQPEPERGAILGWIKRIGPGLIFMVVVALGISAAAFVKTLLD